MIPFSFCPALRHRWVVLVCAVVSVLFGSTGALASAPTVAVPGSYVALGDSYAAGVGAGSYDAQSGSCMRSTRAYPALWTAAHTPAVFASTACSGARTGDVIAGQLGPLNADTALVSITVGANDAGFADVMTACVLQSEEVCLDRVAQARAYIARTLSGNLDQVYQAVRRKATAARVVVVGYPHLYRLDGTCVTGVGERARAAIDAAADDLDTVIASRAAAHKIAFGDVRSAFTGHEICSAAPWLNSLTFPVEESYHPTAAGQLNGYLPVFTATAKQ
ncbi:SGNH/GDSL hydrolase family protein [Streptomyces sp. NPDC094438]|uniref:SGNH/GDSL hydrolase family protein n=1 Tax=Streptomyces sp. NPDC094438 TaxID=3366061 RepID=UPI0037F1A4C5